MNADKAVSTPEIKDYGQIALMQVPSGWIKTVTETGLSSVSRLSFHPPDNDQIGLVCFYRGQPLSPDAAADFAALLSEDPHTLSADEFKSLNEILREGSDPQEFLPSAARTENRGLRKVLVIEGLWKNSQLKTYWILVDASPGAEHVQEIYFCASDVIFDAVSGVAIKLMQELKLISSNQH